MIKYIAEDDIKSTNVFLIDEDHKIKILVAVVFDQVHARIIIRQLNEYANISNVRLEEE